MCIMIFMVKFFLFGCCFERVFKGLVNNIEFLLLFFECCGNLYVLVKLMGVRIIIRLKMSDFL